ncbi:hypothetical protein [Rhizorhabdus argentea]|uniref:hypothetical protein n=1 Tax=Rhizorhabdus argentea TaxID=1387174 RepID=UPI0030EE9ECD
MNQRTVISHLIAMLLTAGVTSSCTGQKLAKLPRCDGGHRRDANPYGSILPGAPKPAVTAPATPGKPVAALNPVRSVPAPVAARTYPSC